MQYNKEVWKRSVRAAVALKTVATWIDRNGTKVEKKIIMSHAAIAYDLAEEFADWETGEGVWVSQATVADMWGASRTSVVNPAFHVLEALGFMKEDPSKAKNDSKYYDLTMPAEMPEQAVIDERVKVRQQKRAEEKRVQREALKKAQEAPVSPSEETRVSEEPEVIAVPENPIVGQDEASESPTEEVVAEVFTKPEEAVVVIEGQAKTVLDSSRSKELATAYYLDVNFAAGDEEVVRAAKAKMEAEYDEYRFAPEFDDYGDETLVEFILRMKNSETVNA